MPLTTSEELTRRFYDWELRGRGWDVYPVPVDLEPCFVPFFGHFTARGAYTEAADDGVRHTLVSGVLSLIKRAFLSRPVIAEQDDDNLPQPILFECDESLVMFSVVQPKGERVAAEDTEQLLIMLSYTQHPVAFEILATAERIVFQVTCRESDAKHVQSQLQAFFPASIVREHGKNAPRQDVTGLYTSIIDYGLAEEFMRPLAMQKKFDPDPLIGLYAVLGQLERGEHAAVQILFKGAVNPWAESIMRAVTDNGGGDFFENAPDMMALAKEKVSAPLFGVTIKTMGEAVTGKRAEDIAEMVGDALTRIVSSKSNRLIPLAGPYAIEDKDTDLVLRQSRRQGMLLNTRELATIVHLPSESVRSAKLERRTRKTKPAPAITQGHQLILGQNEHSGTTQTVTQSPAQRLKHTHIIGATGTGKSTMLQHMIAQDIQAGNGVAVIDPHGDLIEFLLACVPDERMQDVIVFDPADTEYPVGFNILSAHSELEKDILSSDLVAVFKRLSTSWGDQMNSVFANAILAFLEHPDGGTLIELRRFLVEKRFRDEYLQSVSDPSVVYYWQKEFPLLKSGSIGSILTRLDAFLRPKLIRNMVAQKKGLDFENILDGKILFVKLSQGLIGIENSYLLGTFFITKFYQAATGRQSRSMEARKDFFVYVDEFQNFITPSMSAILAGARKYHLGLVLAHQEMQQLVKYDSELAASVVANAGTRICFRLADTDARRFANGFSFFEQHDLENLNTGEAIGRIERPDYDFSLTSIPIHITDEAGSKKRRQTVLEQSRTQYGTPRADVEALFAGLKEEAGEEPTKAKPTSTTPPEILPRPEAGSEEMLAKPVSVQITEDIEIVAPVLTQNLIQKKAESEHRYLQTLIKKMAEARGFKAVIEAPTPDGNGRVDVSLERDGKRIACEICVTTETGWELHNTEKCLAADYDVVINVSKDRKSLDKIQRLIERSVKDTDQGRIYQFEPEQLFAFLDEQVAKEATTEQRMKGYRVKVDYTVGSSEEAARKKVSVGNTVLGAKKAKKSSTS